MRTSLAAMEARCRHSQRCSLLTSTSMELRGVQRPKVGPCNSRIQESTSRPSQRPLAALDRSLVARTNSSLLPVQLARLLLALRRHLVRRARLLHSRQAQHTEALRHRQRRLLPPHMPTRIHRPLPRPPRRSRQAQRLQVALP